MTGKEKAFILQALVILASGDSYLGEHPVKRFGAEIQIPEARCFYGFQMMQSNIHSELFTIFFEMFKDRVVRDESEDTVSEIVSLCKAITFNYLSTNTYRLTLQ